MPYGISECGSGDPHRTIYDAFGFILCNYDCMSAFLANQFSPVLGMLLNIAALAVLILFGCHNPFMFNQSTLVLGYLLLYGYDVTGKSYQMRLVGMALGAALTCFVFYRNHKNRTYKKKSERSQNKMADMSDFMRTDCPLHCRTL